MTLVYKLTELKSVFIISTLQNNNKNLFRKPRFLRAKITTYNTRVGRKEKNLSNNSFNNNMVNF